jgi:hypothetical protein
MHVHRYSPAEVKGLQMRENSNRGMQSHQYLLHFLRDDQRWERTAIIKCARTNTDQPDQLHQSVSS